MSKNRLGVKITAYFLISSIILLFLFIAFETYFRFKPEFGRAGFEYDKKLIWRLNDGLIAQKHYAMGKVPDKEPFTLKFNKSGFRGADFSYAKNEDVTRIMVLGDSYTAGLDYPDDEVFTQQFENLLNSESSRYEVMNISCPAWGTDQHFLYWINEGIKYKPDYLIIMMAPNDMREMYNKKIVTLSNNKALNFNKLDKIPNKELWGWWLSTRSSFYQFLQKKVFKTNYGQFERVFWFYPVNYGQKDSTDWDAPIFLKEPFKEVNETYALLDEILDELIQSCEQTGTKLLLAKIPTLSEFNGSYETEEHSPGKITNRIKGIAERHQLPFLNLNDSLKLEANPLDIFMSWEYHFDKDGHDYTARELYEFFKNYQK